MTELKRSNVQKVYNEATDYSISIARLVKTVMNTSMRYASNRKIIELGLRRCEINGVKYSDIDYINRTLKLQRQLGKKPNTKAEYFPAKTFTKQEIGLK